MKRKAKKVTISKTSAAESQLETAIKLFFEGRDILSAYTLSAAADGILEGLWSSRRKTILSERGIHPDCPPPEQQSWREIFDDMIVPEHKKEAISLFNRTQNFLKHADKDPELEHEFDPFHETSLKLMAVCRNFSLVTGGITETMKVYMDWSAITHPHLLKAGCDLKAIIEALEERDISPEDALAAGLILLKKNCPKLFREDQPAIRRSPYSFKLPIS